MLTSDVIEENTFYKNVKSSNVIIKLLKILFCNSIFVELWRDSEQ
jgi:hypothetical protein